MLFMIEIYFIVKILFFFEDIGNIGQMHGKEDIIRLSLEI